MRGFILAMATLGCVGWLAAWAGDPPKKLTAEERKELEAKWDKFDDAGFNAYQAGKFPAAEKGWMAGLEVARRLYPKTEFPDGHANLAQSLNNLAALYQHQGKWSEAEPLFKDALDMRRRLFKGDHSSLATSMNNLAALYEAQGKLSEAEPLYKDALDMLRRVFKGDHPNMASSMSHLAGLYQTQGKLAEAEPLYKDALDMRKRLFKGDHPNLATGMNNLAFLYQHQGKLSEAEPLLKDALEMFKRLFKGDHRDVAQSLSNLGLLFHVQGKFADAELHSKVALEMYRRLIVAYAKGKSEGEALTHAAAQPLARDIFLSVVRLRALDLKQAYDLATAYSVVWVTKGTVARVTEQRQLQARATTDPALTKMFAEQADARRRRAELLLAPATKDPGTLKAREADLTKYDATIATLTKTLSEKMPAVARIDKLNDATLAELQKVLPADAAMVDFYHYTFSEWDNTKPVGQKTKQTKRYAAFVVTRDKVAWVDLDTAEKIEKAVSQWREAITTAPSRTPAADLPAKVRELVWEPVRKHLPASTKVVYVCPGAELTRVPWAALPGDKPGTILLEDFAIAAIPHAPFLLDSLWPADKRENPPVGLLAVGGVAFQDEPQSPTSGALASRTRGDLPIDPKKKLIWPDLPGAKAEVEQVAKRASSRMLDTRLLTGAGATTDGVLAELPRVKYAHIATHGFFADASFRSVLQVDPKDYEKSSRGERIGAGAKSPMVMSGLVFAGANRPETPARGIVTGEQLIDRDLSGLELAVLSACETGLGDIAGGEGVFGLQRAFHVAGARNVVASLWKVNDDATAALMGEFYRQLWDLKQPPIEALRQAQLAVYRVDPTDFKAMALRGVGKGDIKNPDVPVVGPPMTGGKTNPPALWAAFSLSGIGR